MMWLRQRDQFNWMCWIIQRFLISWRTNTDRTADGKADNVVGNDHSTIRGLDVFEPPPGARRTPVAVPSTPTATTTTTAEVFSPTAASTAATPDRQHRPGDFLRLTVLVGTRRPEL
jgi:hypothetical protein